MGSPTGKTSACPECRAQGRDTRGDNLVHYKDGSAHCHACGYDQQPSVQQRHEDMEGKMEFEDVARLPIREMPLRGIDLKTAQMFGVRCELDPETGEPHAYYFPLYRKEELTGYQGKIAREPGQRQKKDVFRVGETKGSAPFGSHVGQGGRMCIVVEGAEDAMAASQMLRSVGKKYRVVAVLGTDGWKRCMEYFSQFDKLAIAFDQDEAGRRAAQDFAQACKPGQANIMRWEGGSDPNALLNEHGADVFLDALNNARPYQASGLVWGEEVWDRMASFVEPKGIPFPEEWAVLNDKVKGIREAEITMFTGGSSTGKTAYTRRMKHHILTETDWRIGEVELEERGERTWRGLMECELGQRWADASLEERRAAYEGTYGTGRIITLDHRSQFGRGQSLVAKFKHLHYAMGCKALFLDHVTLAVMEFGDGQGNAAQDQMMNEFLELVESTGVHLFLVSHLRKSTSGGESFEEGAVPSMDDLKGSGSLKQISFNIIGVSRNLQHEDDYERNVSQLHVLKCRETGKTGRADRLWWDDDSRKLTPAREPKKESKGEGEPPSEEEPF